MLLSPEDTNRATVSASICTGWFYLLTWHYLASSGNRALRRNCSDQGLSWLCIEVGRPASNMGDTISWAGLCGENWACENKQARMHSFLTALSCRCDGLTAWVSALTYPQWQFHCNLECKPNHPLPPYVAFGQSVCHGNRNKTGTLSQDPPPESDLEVVLSPGVYLFILQVPPGVLTEVALSLVIRNMGIESLKSVAPETLRDRFLGWHQETL